METIIGGGAAAEASIKDSSDAEFMVPGEYNVVTIVIFPLSNSISN